ncbi:DUF4266 domain-containing protein [Paraglaciecola hydrolytica]|uniref:DUF4266 domain-containing protein n=1 Tax=Paraglaciecola hydrolytica TaxID=1799789 RepID=A0A136A1Q8_9ALTE|nr:DUF4266 domain-containing protein [Paraglaciecola hydrolytica]KXI29161.1 hypothetical protein AX660_13480 [Paraglaciecola hydrolytica]
MVRALKRQLLILSVCSLNIACASIEPWVQPYERENLADPIMSVNRNPVASAYTHHAFGAREGSRGADGGAGGGCGCN